MFEQFRTERIKTSGATIHTRIGGEGPPLLLLHGYPQTHFIWHEIAPHLTDDFTVVVPDLRGYGDSSKPPSTPDHAPYTKRAMALDLVEVMEALGFGRFSVAGHDRGGRITHRMAVDHPQRLEKAAVLDISPTLTMYERTTMALAQKYWHWFFLIQEEGVPETMIGANPEFFLRQHMGRGSAGLSAFKPPAWAEYVRCFTPEAIHATCEDYRAAATTDLVHDRESRERGERIQCPLLVLWGEHGVIEELFTPLDDWRAVATDVRGHALPCGHYLPEEQPELVLQAFREFFRNARGAI
ncbi:alpha/beta fold hydrolase [Deinococcus peraridilitoris]|uniref:Putative hydrolase or acyltransferase of alpha/beta superfamily n=1 Tax=Deinococcus peraridilitoris (strain DSM 19664 / LMG 22246 / CIP 109416 / KR-200) TaxID=937777 RepID=L0A091_DEIPD|nr:alpha/beta hydrolase [Deinococcus peraridilitoris]AFZ66435.1 putative hydrolase or acyltransferase of alpha/beta superfamily [Deinococcus peraridilitoris DSM 19664]